MRKLRLTQFIALALLSSCYSSYQTSGTVRDFSEEVTFTIDKIEEGNTIVVGNKTMAPKKGQKYVFIYMTFTNKTSEPQYLEFNTVFLAGSDNKTKYKLEMAMRTGAISSVGKTDSELGAKDSMRRKLVFAAPQKMKPQNLFINNKLVAIEYVGSPSKK